MKVFAPRASWLPVVVLGFSAIAMILSPSQAVAQGYVVSPQTVAIDFGGGSGGRNITSTTCDPGFLAVGFRGRTGQYFNQVWLECSPLQPDGTLGRGVRMTPPTGTPGGSVERSARCPAGLVLRGLKGNTGGSIDRAAGSCGYPRDIGDRVPRPRHSPTAMLTIPSPGGQPAAAVCPVGSAMVGFQTRNGAWIDHLWILCAGIRTNQGGGPPPVRPIPGGTWRGDPVAVCINAVRARAQQDFGNRVGVTLPPAAARVTPVPVGQLLVPVSGTGQINPPGQPPFNTRYDCQVDKRFGTVSTVNYTRPGVQPQPR
jgi:hypothetical protein